MDVVHPRKARSGSNIFQYGAGDLQIGVVGNQDEDVDIDDGDADAVPHFESRLRNDASVAGVSGGATGVKTGAKSMAGSTPVPREVVAVSTASSHGRREQHTAGSQGSIGRSPRHIVVGRSSPQPNAPEDDLAKDSEGSIPKVSDAKESRTQMSAKANGVQRLPSVGLSHSLSKSVDRNDEDGVRSLRNDAQTIPKRKALEIEPSTSSPAKRTKVHGNASDASDMPRKNIKAEELQPRDMSLSTRKEDSPSKRKERFNDREGEGRETTPRASGMFREKRSRVLVLGDETDDDMQDKPQWTASQKSDGKGKFFSGVNSAAEVSPKNDSYAYDLAKTGPAGSGKQASEKQRPPLTGENGVVPFRSAFPLNAKKKVHPPVSGDDKSHAGAGYATHSADRNTPFTWITCTKCKKIRKVNADANLKRSSWCCERNTRDPKYASCSAPQEQNDHKKACEIPADDLEVLPGREARTEGQVTLNQTEDEGKSDKEKALRNMVWVKVDGKEFWWPGMIVTEVPPTFQKKIDDFTEKFKISPQAARLFHPQEDVDEYQIVKRSSLKPFHLCLSYKDRNSHPDFLVAVTEAEEYCSQADAVVEGFFQPATGSNEGPKLNVTGEDAGCLVENVPHEQAESNELEFEDVETLGDVPQGSQPQTDNETETLEDGEVNQVPVEEGVNDLSPEASNGSGLGGKRDDLSPEAGSRSGLSDKRDDLQCSQSQADKERVTLEDEEVIQVPVELGKVEDSPEARNHFGAINENDEPQCVQSQADEGRLVLEDEEVVQGSVEQEEDVNFPKAGDRINSSNDPQCSPSEADKVKVVPGIKEVIQIPVEQGHNENPPKASNGLDPSANRDEVSDSTKVEVGRSEQIHTDVKVSDDVEASERTKVSDASGLEELYGSGENLVLNLEISPTRRLIAYDDTTKILLFQDGAAVSIDADSLGKELNKSSTGRTLHECIHEVGKLAIRRRFPKSARSSNGLKFDALDQSDNFAKRLRDTWLREYGDESMPEFLKTRFVAGCILEERGEPVNWAHELTRNIRSELKEITVKARESLSPDVLKLIVQLLEKQVDQAPLPVFKAVKGEEPMDFTEYDRYCQQCKIFSGELLCCDGSVCRKTYHLKCLNPPLEEVPLTAFFCPSCTAEASKPPGVEVGSSSVVEYGINLHADDVSRQERHGVSESTTLVRESDTLKRHASVDSRMNLEVGVVTAGSVGEHPRSKRNGECCVSSADTFARTATLSGGITLVANNLAKDATHQPPNSNAHGTEHTALENTNVVVDICVSRMVADATVGEESQIRSTPRLVVDSLQTKKDVLSEKPQKMQAVPGDASVSIGLRNTITASPLGPRSNSFKGLGGERNGMHVGSSRSCIRLTDNEAIQLVNRDERSGNRVESSLLCGFTNSPLPKQPGNDVESDLEEGEISPTEQANASGKAADKPVSKLTGSSHPQIPQDISSGVELLHVEDEFPSSDDHNSICEGCEVGGELMLCDGKGCKVVYHKECLDPPLQTVPAGEWYCPECEKRKVEKIWSVRKACSVVRGRADTTCSDASGSGNFQGDQYDSEDEAQDDMPLSARFGSSAQRPDGEVAANELGKASGSGAEVVNTNLKDDDLEYRVQWKSRSHAHDKWVSEKELEKIAPKELARFKKLHQGQEKYDSEWAEPERVIQKRLTRVTRRQPDAAVGGENNPNIQNAEIEWFVKWKGLGYQDCTWEPADAGVLATPRGIELINAYERWADAAKQRARLESQEEAEKRVNLPIKDLNTQPEWMIRPELLPLQLEALNKLRRFWHSRMNGILVYEASQEKIVMTIMFFLSLVEEFRVVRPILVVVPKSLIQNWEHELYQWAPKLYIVNYASKMEEARDIIRRTEFSSFSEPFRPQIVLATFEVINCDMDHFKKVEWEALIIDEGRRQRLQKSYQKSYRPFSQLKSTFRLLLLSEPLKSNVEELIQFVNFLEPRKSVFQHGDESTQVTELQRRLTGRVLQYIPENRLSEYWVPVEMTPVHLDQYYNLLVRHYPTLSRNHRDHQIQEVVTTLRQSCNHPFLADPALEGTMGKDLTPKELLDHHIEISGKMRLLHLMMPILKAANWRVLIFSQDTKQLDILERYMTQSHGSDSYERVDSDLAVKAKEAAIQRFNAEGSKRFVLLLKTGVHISFKNVQFVLIYDSDWNPVNDMRALHKIHNEGEASSKPLPVLRLYTHLTVEESTLILFRDKQLPPTRANVNAKICQKLLTWGASKIFDRYDNSKCPTGSSYRPKGAKFCPKAKLKQVVYKSEVVQKLLEALFCQEEGSKFEGDELLDAILVPRDEPALLFAESDHPINMITGDSAEAFWASSLKWRHDDWQAKEVNMLGKGHRGKKRITYDEDAMATAVYNEAQFSDESERKRPRRRKASSEEEQEVVTGPSDPVSFQQLLPSLSSSLPPDSTLPVTSPQVDTALPSDIPDREQLQENTDTGVLPRAEVLQPAHGPLNHDLVSNQNSGSEFIRDPRGNIEKTVPTMLSPGTFREVLSTIFVILELPGPVTERVDELFRHITSQKSLRKSRARHEIIAIELALVWLAADQMNHAIDKTMCISTVEERLNVTFENRPQLVGPVYKKVTELCANYKPRPAPPAIVSTTSQPALVPEIISSRNTLLNHPPRAELKPSSRNVSAQATKGEQPARNLPENPLAGSQETGQQVEAEVSSPVVLSAASLPVQVPLPTDNAPAVEESHAAHTADDPVVEVDTDVVLVGADPRLVPEESLHTFIDQSRFAIPDPCGRIISSASTLEQGLGWVLVSPTPDVLVGPIPQEAVLDVPTPAGDSSSTPRCAGDFQSHVDSLQRGREEVVSARLGASPLEVPGIRTSELPVESTSSPLTQTQVLPTQNIEPARQTEQVPARQNEQAAPDTPARLKERLHQDMAFVIRGQTKEIALNKSQADQKLDELKRKHDESRRQPTSDPSVVSGREALYNSQKKTLERLNLTDSNALDARLRADRDKLRDLYSKLTSSTSGEGASLDVRKIESEIQRIKDHYSKFVQPSLIQSPLQGSSLNQRPALRSMAPTRSSPSTTEASPTSTVQADGGSRVARSLASANPAEEQQRQHVGRSSSPAIPVVMSSPQQQGHSVQSVTGEGLSNSQRPATAVMSTAPMQHTGVQPRGHLQRSNAPVHPGPMPNLQRGAAVVSRSLSTPAMVPIVPPGVGHMARPSAPASVTPQAGNATGHAYPDVLLKEKEKLSKDLEKAKVAYESESQRIKAEYDKEAEILHKKYEALLVEQHRVYTKSQQQVQQYIMKVEWNRQLAEALKLREELAARAAIFAGLSSQTAVQPFVNQQPLFNHQAPQQIPGRPLSGGTAVAPVPANISRIATNIGNAGPGVSGVTMQLPGTSSTRVSTASVHHSPRYGMPVAPQNDSPRYGMPVAPQNEQSRSLMSQSMAVLAASGNAGNPGNNIAAGISRAQLENVCTPSPEPMNLDTVAGSPLPRTSGSSLPGVVAPLSAPPFQDPILSIIRNSVPSLDPVVVPSVDPVVVPSVDPVVVSSVEPVVVSCASPRETSTAMGITAVGMPSLSNPQLSGPANPLPAGIECPIPRSSQAIPDPQIYPEAHSDYIIDEVPVRLSTGLIGSGTQEKPVANVAAPVRPPNLIYLSDSDED